MSKLRVNRRIYYSSNPNLTWEQMSEEELNSRLASTFAEVKKLYPDYDTIKIEFRTEDDFAGDTSLCVFFYGERDETDGEYQERIEAQKRVENFKKKAAEIKEKQEKELYEKLKAKFEPNV